MKKENYLTFIVLVFLLTFSLGPYLNSEKTQEINAKIQVKQNLIIALANTSSLINHIELESIYTKIERVEINNDELELEKKISDLNKNYFGESFITENIINRLYKKVEKRNIGNVGLEIGESYIMEISYDGTEIEELYLEIENHAIDNTKLERGISKE